MAFIKKHYSVIRKRANLGAWAVFIACFAAPVLFAGAIVWTYAAAAVFAGRKATCFCAAATLPTFFAFANTALQTISALSTAVIANSNIAALSSPVLFANASL